MHTNPRKGLATGLAAGVLVMGLAACGTMNAEAEDVFLKQNQVSSALMQAIMAAELEDPGLADRLYGQEAELRHACGPLQKAGYQDLHAEEVDGSTKLAAFNALRACAVKSTELVQLIWQVDPVTAKGYLGHPKGAADDSLVGQGASPRPLNAMADRSYLR